MTSDLTDLEERFGQIEMAVMLELNDRYPGADVVALISEAEVAYEMRVEVNGKTAGLQHDYTLGLLEAVTWAVEAFDKNGDPV